VSLNIILCQKYETLIKIKIIGKKTFTAYLKMYKNILYNFKIHQKYSSHFLNNRNFPFPEVKTVTF